jgi:2-polyprenyl-6-methoxyphenol hydroxylase-like FAD-dependent oxidoreductase
MTMIFVAWPVDEFNTFRADVEGSYMATIDLAPALAERVRQGRRAERIVGTADLPNFYRKPYGPGWALVGDAGHTKDPITGLGIMDAFRDSELLTDALDAGFAGRQPLEDALDGYEQKRNAASKPGYEVTLDIARMNPLAVEQVELFKALQRNPAAATQFFGVITGVVNPADFFAPKHLFQIIGMRGMSKIMLSRMLHRPQRRAS